MYVCMYACLSVCLSVCMYVRMYVCTYVTHIGLESPHSGISAAPVPHAIAAQQRKAARLCH